jgi:heterodisulfide reductase subunit A-like polyferredoxin/coenzyme F420-reducing hydrogenase delta subunit
MDTNAKIGVFLCQCGNQIEPLVDLKALEKSLGRVPEVTHVERMPYPCQKPGIERITTAVAKNKLNRIVVAGCEGRLMLKKFEKGLTPLEIRKGQIEMVNLRGHVAQVSDLPPEDKAVKAAKLVKSSVAELAALVPSGQTRAQIEGPVVIVGGGVASYTAAQELARRKIDYLLALDSDDPNEIMGRIHHSYPGERAYYRRLQKTVTEALTAPQATVLVGSKLVGLSGVTGDYSLTFSGPNGTEKRKHKAGAILACLDAHFEPPGPEFGHDGQSVMIQSEMEEHIQHNGVPKGGIVFWISDYEAGQPEFAPLSARSAWFMAAHMLECSPQTHVVMLYNQQMEIPLSAAERALNRNLGIYWIAYDKAVKPSVQDGFITFCNLEDHMEHEIPWDYLVLSPERTIAGNTLDVAENLGLVHKGGRFLTGHHAKVRPEMVGREETYLAGSARWPCDLHEALTQGRNAGSKTAEMLEKSANGELMIPRLVCVVDPTKCVGCGQCQELCDCGGIGVADLPGGGLPRVVDPMVCTGGGTCAAACPYHALVLQNNTNDQREAKVAALARELAPDEVMAFACGWGGLPAADLAGKNGLNYDPRVHILGIPCVGQIDPCVMVRAFKEGANGLILVGCLPEECHHSYGVDHAWSRVSAIKKLLTMCGFDRRRLSLAHADLNKPKDFIRTVESFSQTINDIGPIPKTAENQSKLDAMYDLIKDNTRIRHLISAGLRRPWENAYRGDQRHALDYDRDFTTALTEEFLQQRLIQVMKEAQRPFKLAELAGILKEDQQQLVNCLWDMVNSGTIDFSHVNREAVYALNN